MNVMIAVNAIYEYKIATALKQGETLSYSDLGQRIGMDPVQLKRLMRMAVANYIFEEPTDQKGYIRHTALSRAIAEDFTFNSWTAMVSGDLWPLGPKTVAAIKKWPASSEPAETAFALVHGTSLWNALSQEPSRAMSLVGGMKFLQSHPAFSLEHLFRQLDWNNDAPTMLVDVGGSEGSIGQALLLRYP